MKNNRTIFRFSLLMAIAIITLLTLPLGKGPRPSTAEACWDYLRIECFDSTRQAFPWCLPSGSGRCWRRSPNVPQFTWGPQERIYSVRINTLCGEDDDQSLWIMGGPGTRDPLFDDYSANLNTYTTYGPLDLTNAVEAQVQFSLYFHHALDIQDTICWGADSVFTLATTHIWVDSVFSGATDEGWRLFTMDLKDLYRNVPTRDSVSALGRPAVYIYWWFRSDADQIVDIGAFIDDVIVVVDDGGMDIEVLNLELRDSSGVAFPGRVETGDHVRARVSWGTCPGGIPSYPDFHAILYLDGNIVFDSLMTDVPPDAQYIWLTEPLLIGSDGDHEFQLVLDPLGEVTEDAETNNTISIPFTSYPPNVPPTFEWIIPSVDTLPTTSGIANLSWLLSDPDGDATVTIHIDTDSTGCIGPIVPRTINRPETETPDTVAWNTNGLPIGSYRYLYAEYGDEFTLFCEYSPYPVLILGLDADDNPVIPSEFALNQNYPNPFNPETQISFSITRGGHTTLTVFDITGREVATLIDNDLTPGSYESNFNAGINRPSGVYLYRLDAPEGSITKKMILMK